jgi:hypothetical protein
MFDAVNNRGCKKDHHGKPHAHMIIQISDRLLKLRNLRDRKQQTSNDCVGKQHYTQYLPPGFSHECDGLSAIKTQT